MSAASAAPERDAVFAGIRRYMLGMAALTVVIVPPLLVIFAAVFGAAYSNLIAFSESASLANPQLVVVENEGRIHPRLARHPPGAVDPDVGRKIRGREEVFRQHAIGGRGDEPGVRRIRQLGSGEIWMS